MFTALTISLSELDEWVLRCMIFPNGGGKGMDGCKGDWWFSASVFETEIFNL